MQYLLITAFVWAFSYGLIKTNLTTLDPNFVTFCRMAAALPIFLPFLKIKSLSFKHMIHLFIIGAVQYGLMYLFFIRSFQYLNAHQAALFTTFTPFYVILINNILVKKFTPVYFIAALIAVLGGGIIYYQYLDYENIFLGFLLVQLADICFAFGQIAYKKFRMEHVQLRDLDIYALLVVGALVTAAFSTTWFQGWGSINSMTKNQLLVLVYLGSIASGICFFWWNKGAVHINPGTLAVFNNIKSPLAILVSLIFFNETTDIPRLFCGLALIGLALFLSEYFERKSLRLSTNLNCA